MLIVLAAVVLFLVALYYWNYPRWGHVLYKHYLQFEANRCGLSTHKIEIDGIMHHYFSNNAKDKPMLLLLHGFSADKTVWLRMAKFFVDDYHVIIPDMAGHGHTGFDPSWDYSIPAQAKRMHTLVSHLGGEKIIVAGNSMGGFIAARMMLTYPETIEYCILIDPAGLQSPMPSKMNNLVKAGHNPFLIDTRHDFNAFYKMTMAKRPYLPTIVKDAMASFYAQRKLQLELIFTHFNQREHMLGDKLKPAPCPTLILWGELDELIHVSAAKIWQTQLQCELEVWNDLGHMPMMEAPRRTAKRIQQFLANDVKS